MTVPLSDQIAAVVREIAMRRRVYPVWVKAKRMTEAKAGAEIAAMEAVLASLRCVAGVNPCDGSECALRLPLPDGARLCCDACGLVVRTAQAEPDR